MKIPKEKRRKDVEGGVKHRSPLSKATSVAVSALLALAMFPIVAVADDEASEASEAPIEAQENLETQPVDDAPGNQTVDTGDSTGRKRSRRRRTTRSGEITDRVFQIPACKRHHRIPGWVDLGWACGIRSGRR